MLYLNFCVFDKIIDKNNFFLCKNFKFLTFDGFECAKLRLCSEFEVYACFNRIGGGAQRSAVHLTSLGRRQIEMSLSKSHDLLISRVFIILHFNSAFYNSKTISMRVHRRGIKLNKMCASECVNAYLFICKNAVRNKT